MINGSYDATPQGDRCEKCGRGPDTDLRFVSLRDRTRSVGRTLCETCTESMVELMLDTDPKAEATAR